MANFFRSRSHQEDHRDAEYHVAVCCEERWDCCLQACMVLRLEAEEVTQYTDDLDADAKRDLLACLLHSVDEVLLFFRTVSQNTAMVQ